MLTQTFVGMFQSFGLSSEQKQQLTQLIEDAIEGHLCSRFTPPPTFPAEMLSSGDTLFPTRAIVQDQDRYYLQKNWVYETYILEKIKKLQVQPAPHWLIQESLWQGLEEHTELLPKQKEALQRITQSGITLICGGPGTGKTYTARQFLSILSSTQNKKLRVVLSAPTAKAATHLGSLLSDLPQIVLQTKTLHSLLQLLPGENRLFSSRLIDADLVIVDEASMMDVSMMAHLLEAIGDETRLVLMGDPYQLPPVGSQGILQQMAGCFGVFLDRIMRTDCLELQTFAQNIYRLNASLVIEQLNRSVSSLKKQPWSFDDSLIPLLYEWIDPILSMEKPDPEKAWQWYQQKKILNSLRKGPFGVDALNKALFARLQSLQKIGHWWAIPIIVIVNDAISELYNGTPGVLIGQRIEDAKAYFFKEGRVEESSSLPLYKLGFCLSVHQAQGSEYQDVLALFPEGSGHFGKEALYTAVTRSKRRLEIVGDEATLIAMLEKRCSTDSGLKERYEAL